VYGRDEVDDRLRGGVGYPRRAPYRGEPGDGPAHPGSRRRPGAPSGDGRRPAEPRGRGRLRGAGLLPPAPRGDAGGSACPSGSASIPAGPVGPTPVRSAARFQPHSRLLQPLDEPAARLDVGRSTSLGVGLDDRHRLRREPPHHVGTEHGEPKNVSPHVDAGAAPLTRVLSLCRTCPRRRTAA